MQVGSPHRPTLSKQALSYLKRGISYYGNKHSGASYKLCRSHESSSGKEVWMAGLNGIVKFPMFLMMSSSIRQTF